MTGILLDKLCLDSKAGGSRVGGRKCLTLRPLGEMTGDLPELNLLG